MTKVSEPPKEETIEFLKNSFLLEGMIYYKLENKVSREGRIKQNDIKNNKIEPWNLI